MSVPTASHLRSHVIQTSRIRPWGAALAVLLSCVSVRAADEDVIPIAFGDVVEGAIDFTTDVDCYGFTASEGQTVFLDRLSSDNLNGLNWSLEDAFGRVLLSAGQFADLGAVTLMGGEYTVVVEGELHDVGSYAFTIREPGVDAATITLDTEFTGSIDVPGDVDRWTYDSLPGDVVSLDLRSSSAATQMEWRLVDAAGRELLVPGNSLSDAGPFVLNGGPVLLEVRGEDGNDAVGTYEFALLTVPAGTQSSVALGDSIDGEITVWGERDRFTFDALPGARLSIDVVSSSASSWLNLELRDAFGRAVLGPTNALTDQPTVTLMGGEYTLEITAELGAVGTYAIDLLEPQPTVVTNVAIGDTIFGGIETYGELEEWVFDAPAGAIVSLDVAQNSISTLNWELVDEVGRAVLPKTNTLRDEDRLALMGGEYRIRVTAEQGQSAPYEFILHDVVDSDTPMTLDTPVAAALAAPGERDRYHFNAAPGQVVLLDQLSTSNPFGLGVNWLLEDERGREVLPRTSNFGDQGPFTLMGGDYVLTILGETGVTADYEFAVVDQGIDLSYVAPAATDALGDTIEGELADVGATEIYAFESAGETVLLDLTSGNSQLRWTLRDPVGQVVFETAVMNNTTTNDQGPFALAAGTYAIEVSGTGSSAPSYAFDLVEVIDGEARLALDVSLVGALASGGAVNGYVLSLPIDTHVYFDLIDGDGALDWTLYDPVDQPVFATSSANNSNSHDQGPFMLRAGDYRLELDADGGSAPSFEFVVGEVFDGTSVIAIGAPVLGSVTKAGGTEVFLLDVSDGQRLVFDNQLGSNSLLWELLDPVGQPVFGATGTGSANNGDEGPISLAAGQYKLTFDATYANTFDFAFQVWEALDIHDALALDVDITATSSVPQQQFRYALNVPADGRLFFDGQFGVNNMVWTLIDAEGQVIFGPSEFHTGNSDRGPIGLFAGDYELIVENGYILDGSFGFSVHTVDDIVAPVAIGDVVSETVPGPGSVRLYDLTVSPGQRVLFSVTEGSSDVLWTLSDEHGETGGLFADAKATIVGNHDQGPFELAGGDYRLELRGANEAVPDFSFSIRNVDQDLRPESVTLSMPVLFEGDLARQTDVTWTVRNLGGPDDLLGSWTDRIVLSNDTKLGDADDVVLGEFAITGPVASLDVYEQTRTVTIPDESILGDYRVFVVIDAFDDIVEVGGELDNDIAASLSIVPEPTGGDDCIVFDQLEGAEYPAGTLLALSGRAQTIEGSVNVVYVLDVSTSTQGVCGFDSNFDGVLDELDDINGDAGVSSQPDGCEFGTILDSELGATLLLDSYLGQASDLSHAVVVFSASAASADLGPEDAKQVWIAPWDRDQDGDGALDLDTVLRSAYSIGFLACALGTGLDEFTKVNVGCGTNFRAAHLATYDALLGAAPAGRNVIVFLSDGEAFPDTAVPTPDEIVALAALGVDFRGYQLGGEVVTPSLQALADAIDAESNSTGSARSVLDLDDLLFELVQSVAVQAVTVNGVDVDSLDATGRFFHAVEIQPGPNVFFVEAIDSDGSACLSTITLNGVTPEDGAFENLSVVTTSLETDWKDSTFNQFDDTYVVSARATNTGEALVRGPLLMVIDGPTDPTVTVANPDGYAPDGRPFFTFLDTTVDAELEPGAWTPTRTLRFSNPGQVGVDFDVEWLALGNAAPFITSAPPLAAVADVAYSYAVTAADPDGHALTHDLLSAPVGMLIDADTGLISWLPTLDDVGSHGVVVAVDDGWGGRAEQSFTLVVAPDAVNHAPTFTSTPPTSIPVGAAYTYAASASDPDGDALTFELLAGPANMVASVNGVVSWPFALQGEYLVALRVSDPAGASAEQTWTLTAGATSTGPLPPIVFGAPSSVGAVASLYFYAPGVDSSAPVTFSLASAPLGMEVDTTTGRVTWTPVDADVGSHPVSLVADNGSGTAAQSWTITVFDEPLNLPPVITSLPTLSAFVDEAWSYDAEGIDPEGTALSWSLVSAPPGATINASTGVIEWTPSAAPDSVLIAVRATDVEGATGGQSFTLSVFPTNSPPVFTSSPVTVASAGETYTYDANAEDADGHVPHFALIDAPTGMVVNALTGAVTWTPAPADIGGASVALAVTDGFGGLDEQSWTIVVSEDTTPPNVTLFVSQSPGVAFEPVQVCVQASDAATIVSRMLTADGVEVALDAAGCAFVTPTMPGAIALVGMATDASGNTGSDSRLLPIGPDVSSPLVEVISPVPGSILTKPTDIVVSITDDSPGLSWTIDVRRSGTDPSEAVVIGSGTGEVLSDIIATFDPTTLPNDTWLVRILVNDGFTLGGVEYAYELSGALKPALFTIEFDDLVTTLAGVPIAITRRYSSLDRSPGDFGPGWRLGFYGDVDDGPVESTSTQPLVQLLGDEPFRQGSRIYVTRPDGTRVGFTFTGQQIGFPTPALWSANFEPDPGVDDVLEALDAVPVMSNIGGLFFNFAIPYNPELYKLTTKGGAAYIIHERDGLQSIEDAQGNIITVTPDGLFAESGEAIVFERNAAGFITRIVEPPVPGDIDGPAALEYLYDAVTGDLLAAIDQNEAATTFAYDQAGLDHYLTEIMDPLGRPLVRSVYDEAGLLLAYCNGEADVDTLERCVQFDTDVIALQQTITTAKGRRIDFLFDDRGNVVKEIRFLDDGSLRQICRTFDEDDNLTSEIDPAGNATFFTYDDRGNVISRTDPAGRTWTFAYNDCGEITLACDPMGNCTQSIYDDDCNLVTEVMPDGATRHWTYDDLGRQLTYTDATSNTWVASYSDGVGGLEVFDSDLPMGDVAFTQYGPNQEVLYRVDRDGRRIDYAYDDAHQMVSETWDDGTVFDFTHDAAGQVVAMATADAALSMEFSALGAITRVDNVGTPGAPNVVLDYTYDAHVAVTSVSDSLGGLTNYVYDDLDRLVSVQQQTIAAASGRGRSGLSASGAASGISMAIGAGKALGASPLERRVDFVYDDADLVRSIHRASDLGGALGVTETFLDYDCGGCEQTLVQLHHRRASDGSTVHDIDLVRDDAGNIIEVLDSEGLHLYQHDGRGRLLGVQHVGGLQPGEAYVYDGEGNRTDSHLDTLPPVYSYESGEGGTRLLSDDAFTRQYDGEGRLVLSTDNVTGASTSYAWDHRGRLGEVVLLDPVGIEIDRATYVYDPLDRRIRSTESGITQHVVWDARNPILFLDDTGAVVERRMYTREIDEILADEVDGANRWYHVDQVGTLRDLTDDDGVTLGHYVYDTFGNVISAPTNPVAETTVGFQGRDFSRLTGLGDFRSRWYDPSVGRFISLDPVMPMQYVGFENAPHRLTDPRGLTAAISYACLAVAAYNNAVTITKPSIYVWKHWTPKALAGLTGGPENVPPGFPDLPLAAKALIKGVCSITGSAFPGAK